MPASITLFDDEAKLCQPTIQCLPMIQVVGIIIVVP